MKVTLCNDLSPQRSWAGSLVPNVVMGQVVQPLGCKAKHKMIRLLGVMYLEVVAVSVAVRVKFLLEQLL